MNFLIPRNREQVRKEIIEAIDSDDKILIKLYQTLRLVK